LEVFADGILREYFDAAVGRDNAILVGDQYWGCRITDQITLLISRKATDAAAFGRCVRNYLLLRHITSAGTGGH